ncbi:MAG: DUF1254 domain-containing protein [Acidobacteriaceae bacterium]|nr:DUF1254 domain-containing protein [Acidobacteriaceae bacterium]
MRKPSRTLSALITVVLLCGTVAINAQETEDSASVNAQEIGPSDLAEVLTSARNQLPNDLDSSSIQTYLDGVAAYIYGYSLLAVALTERVSTNIARADLQLGRAPINQLYKAPSLPVGSQFKDVVLPTTSAMYSTGFFNLKQEPLILHLPEISSDRHFIVQLLDGWTNVSRRSPTSRLAGISPTPGDYALVGPDWNGNLPSGISETIRFDTNTVWQIMRVYTTGTKDDQDFVSNQIFKNMTLQPLSSYGNPYTPPDNLPVNPSIDVVTQPIQQLDSMDACAFFGTMSAMMMTNPPRKIDAGVVPILERLGIIGAANAPAPTQFSCASQTQAERTALQLAVATGKQILNATPPPSLTPTNWSLPTNVGDYGTRYLLRALVAKDALGANRPQDVVYGYGIHDSTWNGSSGTSDSHLLYGTNRYVLHFKAQTSQKAPLEIPPIDGNGFWSITLYNIDGTLNDNKVAPYHALSTKSVEGHTACLNDDGSLDIYVQSTPPSDPKQLCNWLEAPQPTAGNNNGQFILFLRTYWPDRAITSGRWYPPGINKTN